MIKLVDLDWQHKLLHQELNVAFQTVVSRGRFILGPQVQALESGFADYHQCSYAVGASSGTDALVLALRALNIGAGDEVILPAMTFCATAEAICAVGARPVIVDVEQATLGLAPDLTKAAVTDQTRAIIPVHLHGWPVLLEPFLELAAKRDLKIIEDCAQAHGASESGYPVGSRAQAGCFSFFPAKNLGALGDAGIVVTNDGELAARMRALANHGRHEKFVNEMVGYNARLDELQAAFLNVKLAHLETWNDHRRHLAQRYNDSFKQLPIQLPPAWSDQRQPCFHLYVIHCETAAVRESLRQYLKEKTIQTGIHYPVPLHLQPALAFLNYQAGDFPISECAAECMLSLPIYPGMALEQQDIVIAAVFEFFKV